MLAIGITFVILGLIGLVLPFLQGFLFLAVGLIILSLYSPRVRAWTDKHTKRYPRLHAGVLRIEGWVVKVVGRP